MDRNALIVASVLGIASLVALAVDRPWRMELRRAVVVERDERPDSAQDPRRKLARIQSNLERLVADAPQWPTAQPDPLEAVVDLTAAFLHQDDAGFDHLAAALEPIAADRLARQGDAVSPADYLERLKGAVTGESGWRGRLLRLVALLRTIDAALALEAAQGEKFSAGPFDLVGRIATRSFLAEDRRFDGTRLRLPCRMLKGRRQDFEAVSARLGELAGPLLSCPVADSQGADFALMERIARDPRGMAGEIVASAAMSPPSRRATVAPPPPWDRDSAIAFMADDPDAAEAALRPAATDAAGRLDLALFLHTFRPPSPARDDEIRKLVAAVDAEASAKADPIALQLAGLPKAYDGGDQSLLASLRLASFTAVSRLKGEGPPAGSPYAIPCAIWLKRPELQAVGDRTLPPGLDADVWQVVRPPESGCLAGRGNVPGFPEASLAAFLDASAEADGGAWNSHRRRYPLDSSQRERFGRGLTVDPHLLLDLPEPAGATPYLHWSYLTLGNRAVWERLAPLFETARIELGAFFRQKGLSDGEAAAAAAKVLFALGRGANCGGESLPSLRQLLVEGMAPEGVVALASSREHPEGALPAYNCAAFSPPDPLAHIAVVNFPALTALWPLQRPGGLELDANTRNSFGKTPLMEAARIDALDSARFLLAKGARINADTWQSGPSRTLAHDGRTALMYAAASGSFAMIEALLKAGGDTFQADTQGRRAIDYLLGFGPTPPNTRLNPSQRAEAVQLLF